MEENCKNCGDVTTGNFCSNCGQKKYSRINKKYIWDEVQYTLLHTNKGLLYSVKSILKNPGKTARDFIDGNRVNHYKPILLVFVLSGISTLIAFKFLHFNEIISSFYEKQHMNSPFMADFMTFLASYNSFIMLFCIPLFAITTKIAFRNWGHNYYEHIVMNAYILSCYTLLSIIIVYPIMFIFRHSPNAFIISSQLAIVSIPFILVWFFKEFYKEKSLKTIILRVLLILLLVVVGYIAMLVIAGIVGAIFAMIYGPEALQYIKPK